MRRSRLGYFLALVLVFAVASGSHGANFVIDVQDGPGEGFNDPVLGADRLATFQAAADAWGSILQSNRTIRVAAQMDLMFCDSMLGLAVLGGAGPFAVVRDFPGASVAGTWHHVALANALANQDLAPGQPDIVATFNSDIDNACLGMGTGWCYDVPVQQGEPNCDGPGELDFFNTVYHEIAHGVGMSTFVNTTTGAPLSGFPDVYLRNLVDNQSGQLLHNLSNAQRALVFISASRLKWQENGAVGPKALLALSTGVNGSGRVRMYAPNPLQPGSSVSHFDTAVFPNEIMEPFLTATARDLTTTELMQDVGWSVNQPMPMCVPNLAEGILCLQGGRFRLETTSSRGGGQPYSIDKITDSVGLGNYYNTNNLVTMQKVVDNCGTPADVFTFWWGGITLYDTIVILTDLETLETRVYLRAAGDPSIRDTWPCN